MAIGGVVENQNFCHDGLLEFDVDWRHDRRQAVHAAAKDRGPGACTGTRAYAASTSTTSESSSAVILSRLRRDRGAVARIDPHAVDLDRARGRHQIEVRVFARRIFGGLAGLQRGAQHPRVGADRQRVLVVVEAARERDEAPERSAFGNGCAPQAGDRPAWSARSRSGRSGSASARDCIRRGGCRRPRSSPARRPPRCGPRCRDCPCA